MHHTVARPSFGWLFPLFFASGFAALLYQVVWQRALFTLYGTNVESVTVIVTAFMLGLGAGSLAGGRISRDPRRDVARLFALAEVGIGAFGLVSLSFFQWIARHTATLPTFGMGAVVLTVLLVPTALMGATLPLLVAGAVRRSTSVGASVGNLYFVNTLGSAFAALAASVVLLHALGMRQTVLVAVGINFVIAALTLVLLRREDAAP
jgi:predicted membrane-bound spermidine synthase